MLGTPIHIWIVFAVTTAAALVIDLGVFHRKNHTIGLREALLESAAWISVSLIFNLWLYYSQGPQAGVEFLTGYLVEKSLSVDNIFVFLLIFQSFHVPAQSQHKVLFLGVLGALVMRAVFVLVGVELLQSFHAVLYALGAICARKWCTSLTGQPPRTKTDIAHSHYIVVAGFARMHDNSPL